MHTTVTSYARTTALCCVVGLGAVIPVSTVLTNLFLALLLLAWLLGGRFSTQWQEIKASPPARWSLAVFALFILASFYSPLKLPALAAELLTQKKILLVPLLVVLMLEDKWRWRALYAVFIVLLLSLLLSYLAFIPGATWAWQKASLPVGAVFVNRTTQGLWFILAGWACYGAAYYSSHSGWRRWIWVPIGLLFHINVLYLVSGRTSLVTFIPVSVIACLLLSWRRSFFAIVALFALAVLIYLTSSYVQFRLLEIVQEVSAYRDQAQETSSGLRLFFYEHGWALFTQSPFGGYGTGSIQTVLNAYIARMGSSVPQFAAHSSLHNQFLNWAFQFGVIGLGLILWTLRSYWRSICNSVEPFVRYLMGILLAGYLLSGLLNSPFDSFYEGYFFYFVVGVLISHQFALARRSQTS